MSRRALPITEEATRAEPSVRVRTARHSLGIRKACVQSHPPTGAIDRISSPGSCDKLAASEPMTHNLFEAVAIAAAFASALTAQSKPIFSETFESGKLEPAIWDVRTMGAATVTVEPVEGAHGKFALHA